jgi:RimJ/RimL family protein N-acetyltransferase
VAPLPYPALGNELVTLRPWTAGDVAALLAAGRDPVVTRFRYSLPVDPAQARAWLHSKEQRRQQGVGIELAIAGPGGGLPLGSISLWEIKRRQRTAMISYWLGAEGRGGGLASAAVRLVAGWAFAELALARLGVLIEPDNHASHRLAERCGFVREGRLRSYGEGRDGRRVDTVVYGLLPGELLG